MEFLFIFFFHAGTLLSVDCTGDSALFEIGLEVEGCLLFFFHAGVPFGTSSAFDSSFAALFFFHDGTLLWTSSGFSAPLEAFCKYRELKPRDAFKEFCGGAGAGAGAGASSFAGLELRFCR